MVTVELEGFASAKADNVLVRSGQNAPVRVALSIAAVTESISVTGEAPIVDVTSAQTGQDVTLELTESLPTGRSYQSYLQLVPGVLPSSTGNPAARAGVNFSDVNGVVGQSSDNVYYVEGINVTDRYTGTFGANLNTEIIQEQSVLTGGLSAEYQGAPGLVSNVATKSGGNQFSGSLNYFFQDDSLVADNENTANAGFSTYDTAFTLGGPIVQDKAWFFASYRLLNREEDVTQTSGALLRTVDYRPGAGVRQGLLEHQPERPAVGHLPHRPVRARWFDGVHHAQQPLGRPRPGWRALQRPLHPRVRQPGGRGQLLAARG